MCRHRSEDSPAAWAKTLADLASLLPQWFTWNSCLFSRLSKEEILVFCVFLNWYKLRVTLISISLAWIILFSSASKNIKFTWDLYWWGLNLLFYFTIFMILLYPYIIFFRPRSFLINMNKDGHMNLKHSLTFKVFHHNFLNFAQL